MIEIRTPGALGLTLVILAVAVLVWAFRKKP